MNTNGGTFNYQTSSVTLTNAGSSIGGSAAINFFNFIVQSTTTIAQVVDVYGLATIQNLILNSPVYCETGSTTSINGVMSGPGGAYFYNNAVLIGTGTIACSYIGFRPSTMNTAVPARTYNALVEIRLNGESGFGHKAIIGPGTVNFVGGLYADPVIATDYSTIDAATYAPNVTVTGDVRAPTPGDLGVATINFGTGTWSVSGQILIDSKTATVNASSATVTTGSFLLSTGTWNGNYSSMTVLTTFNVGSSAVFNSGASTITFSPVNASTITGSISFNALQELTPGTTLYFAGGSTTTVTNALNLIGAAGNYVSVASTASTVAAYLNLSGMTRIFITTGTTQWSVPSNWNSANNTIEAIGSGGPGGATDSYGNGGSGGGGGAYNKILNWVGTPGANVNINISSGISYTPGTWFASSTTLFAADGQNGIQHQSSGFVYGGLASSCTPTTYAYSGGTSGYDVGENGPGGGGGGAAGPHGVGANGANSTSSGGNGGAGDAGFGGAAGTGESSAGGNGTEWNSSPAYGSGGGGGGGSSGGQDGFKGGNYGGGGGGGGNNGGANFGGAGSPGLIVITYYPTVSQNVQYVNASDNNASLGAQITDTGGILTQTVNWIASAVSSATSILFSNY